MADQLTAEEIKALQEKAAKVDELTEANETLQKKLESSEPKSKVVNGKFKRGDKFYSFKDGAVNTRLADGQMVPTELLIKLGTKKSIKAEEVKAYPALSQLAEEDGSPKGTIAYDYLSHLVDIGYGLLK